MSTLSVCKRCGHALPSDAPQGQCPRCLLGGDEAEDTSWWQRGTAGGGHTFAPPKVDQLAEYFPQFEILELLGRGGMGAVYLARQRSLQRLVAIKILPPEIAATAGFEDRFLREGQALAKLNHSGIVGVYDFGKTGPYAYLVLEYIEGVNLRTLLRDGHLPPAEALQIVPQLCDALQAAHAQGVVHRDIKPENILLTVDGRVKIADFGVAKLVQPDPSLVTGGGGVVGTFQYMAPEQLERPGTVDHRADIYSLGVVFYEMLTGELPLGRFPVPSYCPGVDVGLDRIVLRALEKHPEMRYASAAHIRTDVESLKPASTVKPATAGPYRREGVGTWTGEGNMNAAEHYVLTAEAFLRWCQARLWDLVCWFHRLGPTILLGLAGLAMILLGMAVGSGSRREEEMLLSLLLGCGTGLVMLRISLAMMGDSSPTVAERFLIVYPLGFAVAGVLLAAIGWPVAAGIGFAILAIDELSRTALPWLDSVREILFAATGGTLLALGINTAMLVLAGLFFPSLVSALVRPFAIRLGTTVLLLFLCVAIAAGTLGGMMVYDVVQAALDGEPDKHAGNGFEAIMQTFPQEDFQLAH